MTVRNQDTALTFPRYRKRLCGWMFLLMAGCGHALRAPEDQIFRGQSPVGTEDSGRIPGNAANRSVVDLARDPRDPGTFVDERNSGEFHYSSEPRRFPGQHPAQHSVPGGHTGLQLVPGPVGQSASPVNVYLPVTLHEAVSSALSSSNAILVLNGGVNVASITPYDVEIARQRVEIEKGRFYPRLTGTYEQSDIDLPPNAFFGPGITTSTRRDLTDASARVTQPLPTGGSLSMGIEPPLAYLYLPNGVNPGQFNPTYSADYVLRVSQPLLRNAGTAVTLAPIRIAQLQTDQTRWDLEETLNDQVRSIEQAYWRLYAAHIQLQAVRSIIPVAEESVRVQELRMQAERSIHADVARARFQLEGFRNTEQALQATVRRRVLELRQLMGGDAYLQPLLLPSEQPPDVPPPSDAEACVATAYSQRPLLNELRAEMAERRTALLVANNGVLPQVDLRGEYRSSGISNQLDNAFRQANTSDYTSWTMGVGVEIPIGNKIQLSRRNVAEKELMKSQVLLAANEKNVAFEVTQAVSDLQSQWERVQIARRQAEQTQEWLRVSQIRYHQPPAAGSSQDGLLLALSDLQSAMRAYVDAVGDVGSTLAEYQTMLADLRKAQGTSLYEWQGQESAPSQPITAGHIGPANFSYRSGPGVGHSLPSN